MSRGIVGQESSDRLEEQTEFFDRLEVQHESSDRLEDKPNPSLLLNPVNYLPVFNLS